MEHLHNAYDHTFMARNHVAMYVGIMHEKHKALYDEFKDDPDVESKLRGHISYLDDVYDDDGRRSARPTLRTASTTR